MFLWQNLMEQNQATTPHTGDKPKHARKQKRCRCRHNGYSGYVHSVGGIGVRHLRNQDVLGMRSSGSWGGISVSTGVVHRLSFV